MSRSKQQSGLPWATEACVRLVSLSLPVGEQLTYHAGDGFLAGNQTDNLGRAFRMVDIRV